MTKQTTLLQNESHEGEADVLVVGASAAGLHAARLLAGGGRKVLVIDAEEELGSPARTLIVTPYLDDILGATPPDIVVNRTGTLRLYSGAHSATVRLGRADLIVERERLIQWLLRGATSAGARVRLGCRFIGLQPDGKRAAVGIEDARGHTEWIRTRVVIGADGVSSELSRRVSQKSPSRVFLQQAVVPMPRWARSTVTQIWFDPKRTRYFFWLIPESQQRGVVGLIADDETQARGALGAFMAEHGLEALEYQEAHVPCYSWSSVWARMIAGTHVYLVGDAAAQVKMTTIGGVVTGLWGAQAAARAILRGTPYLYEAAGLRKELTVHLLLRRVLNRFAAEDYDDLLALLNRVVGGPVSYITRDEAVRLLWKVGLAEPRFALVTARALLARQAAFRYKHQPSLCESRVE
mgnify:CR=1 FL=1